ncbi:MAG: BadM/Rrf2 family transcriptional regulator [Gallionellales bacterium GWA2_60_18]|nr:MAG: BadM/Rrf2 family transcriptional regulator [Gallionellales bacterium GWA2_60_18]
MKLTQYSDLGLRLLMYLALRRDNLVTIREVSERFAISNNHLVKISHQLTRSGLIESVQGRNGGIRLARAPEEINIEEVLRATEDNFDLVECFTAARDQCVISGACLLTGVLEQARAAFFGVLRAVSLADLVKNAKVLEHILQPLPKAGRSKPGDAASDKRSKS